ncbi:MAG: glucokinase [Pseudomonadota bacterium]
MTPSEQASQTEPGPVRSGVSGKRYSLVADIGGTNTRVALARGPKVIPDTIKRFANAGQPGLQPILESFLSQSGLSAADIDRICVAAAGPVHDGVARMTNLDWKIDRDTLVKAVTPRSVAVLNDLQAQGHALPYLARAKLVEVAPPSKPKVQDNPQAARLVVGLGTGFNIAPVYTTPAGRFVPPAEAGHVGLPIFDEASAELWRRLNDRTNFVSVEEALSGRGISQVHFALHSVQASAAEIMQGAHERSAKALETIRAVCHLLGHVVGNLALTFLPFGGIYLVGGVARSLAPWLMNEGFLDAMRDKGRFGDYVRQFSVRVVIDDYAALTGCASHLSEID